MISRFQQFCAGTLVFKTLRVQCSQGGIRHYIYIIVRGQVR
jgi:hypothetical protein